MARLIPWLAWFPIHNDGSNIVLPKWFAGLLGTAGISSMMFVIGVVWTTRENHAQQLAQHGAQIAALNTSIVSIQEMQREIIVSLRELRTSLQSSKRDR